MALNSHEKADELVKRFQEGDQQAGMELLEAFAPYLNRYMRMLGGEVNYGRRADRWFVSLFMLDPELKQKLRKKHLGTEFGRCVGAARSYYQIVTDTIAAYDEEDLRQDMIYEFLRIARKYRPMPGKHFAAYLTSSFPYKVINIVKRIGRNPTMYGLADVVRYNEDRTAEISVPPELWVEEDFGCDEENDSGLGLLWISGELCSEIFADLTPEERQILKLRYLEGFTDSMIAKLLQMRRGEVTRIRSAAVEKLGERLECNTDDTDH